MTDERTTDERMDALERRVSDLEERLGRIHSEGDETDHCLSVAPNGVRDRYDGTVLSGLEVGEAYRLAELRERYEAAGVRDGNKIKDRIKHLIKSGFLENIGMGTWRFVGSGEGE